MITTVAQYEERYVALYGHIVKLLTYNNTTAGEMHIIDQDETKNDPTMSRKISDVYWLLQQGQSASVGQLLSSSVA